ncbi:MAG: metallophosphoesterase [Pirellula sp.]|nr:metallophosphoesterase [Pirellula sp.]
MFKFIHAADIHLDSPLRGLKQYIGAPVEQIRLAARKALENLVTAAITERVDFVLIAGDIYDGDWKDFQTGLFFIQQAARLDKASIPIYLIRGNHDAGNKMTKSLRMPPNVTIFSESSPESIYLDEIGVAIHGQSYPTVSVTKDLSYHYPSAVPGRFNIGLLHTSLTGREGHENYAPCSVEALTLKGYDYWALGHIHQREVVCKSPVIAFSGNVQGRHIKETGAKGCYLVSVDDSHRPAMQFLPLDVLRWELATIDLNDTMAERDVLHRIGAQFRDIVHSADGRCTAVRVRLIGNTSLHSDFASRAEHWVNEIRGVAIQESNSQMWIEKVKFDTHENRYEQIDLADSESAIGELELLVQSIKNNPALLAELGFDLSDLQKKLPSEVRESLHLEDQESILEILNEAHAYLLGQLRLQPSSERRSSSLEND